MDKAECEARWLDRKNNAREMIVCDDKNLDGEERLCEVSVVEPVPVGPDARHSQRMTIKSLGY